MPVTPLEALNSWLAFKQANEGIAGNTIVKYRQWIERLEEFLSERGTKLFAATQDDLVEFTGMFLFKKKLVASSRRTAVAAVRGFYAYLKDNNLIAHNPADCLGYPKQGQRLPRPVDLGIAEKLLMVPDLNTFTGLRDAAIIALLMGTGMRVGGLCGLNESNILRYRHGDHVRWAVRPIEKGSKERLLPLPLDAMLLLQAYMGHPELEAIDRTVGDGDHVLFVSVRNRRVKLCDYHGEARRLTTNGVWRMLQDCAEKAGVESSLVNPRALRHLLGTELAEDSVSPLEIKNILGHSSVDTSDIYIKLALRKLTHTIDTSNPLSKIKSPVRDLILQLKKANQL